MLCISAPCPHHRRITKCMWLFLKHCIYFETVKEYTHFPSRRVMQDCGLRSLINLIVYFTYIKIVSFTYIFKINIPGWNLNKPSSTPRLLLLEWVMLQQSTSVKSWGIEEKTKPNHTSELKGSRPGFESSSGIRVNTGTPLNLGEHHYGPPKHRL